MFDLSSRSAIAMLSALGAAAAIGLTPSPPQRLLVATAGPPPPRVLQSVANPVAPVLVVRDPFAEPTPPAVLAATLPVRLPHRQFGPQLSETVEPLPSNLASDTIPALPDSAPDPDPAAPRVSALVTGPHPYARCSTPGHPRDQRPGRPGRRRYDRFDRPRRRPLARRQTAGRRPRGAAMKRRALAFVFGLGTAARCAVGRPAGAASYRCPRYRFGRCHPAAGDAIRDQPRP